jgi:O-antigen ligase
LLLSGWVIARTQFSPIEYLARWDLFLALGAAVAYFAVSHWFVRSRDRMAIIGVLALLVLVHVVIGGIQFKQRDNFMLLPGIIRSEWLWRASGFYICPNHLAGLLEMMGAMTLAICCWGRVPSWGRILAGYCTLMCMVGIALTGSRGGYLSTVFAVIVFGALSLVVIGRVHPRRFWPMLVVALVLGSMLVGGAFFVMSRSNTLSERLAQINDPNNMRPLMWQAALRQYHLSPAIGTGSGTYLYYGREFRAPTVQNDPIFVHNDYLHILAEYGIIGAALAGVFLLVHIGAGLAGIGRIVRETLLPEWRSSSNELALVIGALTGIAALLAHSLVDFNFHIPANALLGAVLFAILATPSARATSAQRKVPAAWMQWIAPMYSVALIVLAVPLIPGEYFGEIARRALRDRKYGESQALALRSLDRDRKNPNVWFYLGEARHYLTLTVEDPVGRAALHEQAAEAYEEGLRVFPRDTRTLLKLGATLDSAGRYAEAETAFQLAMEVDPNLGNVYAYYGVHFWVQRQLNDAEFYLRKAQDFGERDISAPVLAEIESLRKSDFGRQLLLSPDGPPPPPPPLPEPVPAAPPEVVPAP